MLQDVVHQGFGEAFGDSTDDECEPSDDISALPENERWRLGSAGGAPTCSCLFHNSFIPYFRCQLETLGGKATAAPPGSNNFPRGQTDCNPGPTPTLFSIRQSVALLSYCKTYWKRCALCPPHFCSPLGFFAIARYRPNLNSMISEAKSSKSVVWEVRHSRSPESEAISGQAIASSPDSSDAGQHYNRISTQGP